MPLLHGPDLCMRAAFVPVCLHAARRTSGPLSSIPSNIVDDDLPLLDSAMTGDTPSKQPTAGTAAAAAAGARGAGRRAAAAGGGGGGGGGPEDSDHDMTDADGAHGGAGWGCELCLQRPLQLLPTLLHTLLCLWHMQLTCQEHTHQSLTCAPTCSLTCIVNGSVCGQAMRTLDQAVPTAVS